MSICSEYEIKLTTMEPLTTTTTQWTFIQKIFFRFFFAYFFVVCFPFPLDEFDFLRPVVNPFYDLRNWAISGVGNRILFNLYFATLVSLIWSFTDRQRINYGKLDQWLRLYLRVYLAYFMVSYGLAKVFLVQGTVITESQLALPYGMQKPSNLFWHLLGYSDAFQQFLGWTEVMGGLLLLWRRTVTLGALILVIMMTGVVMVNFCFGINVRYSSLQFLLIAIFLLWNDRGRLLNLFFLSKPAEAVAYAPLIGNPLGRKVFIVIQFIILGLLLYKEISEKTSWTEMFDTPRPLDGIYNTEYFIRGADTIPPLQTDSLRWKRLTIDTYGKTLHFSHVQLSTDSLTYCNTIIDTIDNVIRFQFKIQDGRGKVYDSCRMLYSLPDSTHLFLKGIWKKDSIQVMMKKYDLNNYLLYRSKFYWTID